MKKNAKIIEKIFIESTSSYNKLLANFVKKIVCSYYGVEENLLGYKTRRREVVKCRQISMYLLKKHSMMSLSSIGLEFDKDHATVIHSNRTINAYLDWDKDLQKEINELEKVVLLKTSAMLNNFSIEKDFYYIDLNMFLSVKVQPEKSIIFSGYSELEVDNLMKELGIVAQIKAHKNKGMYVLEKYDKDEEDTNKS